MTLAQNLQNNSTLLIVSHSEKINYYAEYDTNKDGIIDINDNKIREFMEQVNETLIKFENIYAKVGMDYIRKYTNIEFIPIKYNTNSAECSKRADILAKDRLYTIKRDLKNDEYLLKLPEHEAVFEKAKVIAAKILLYEEMKNCGGNFNAALDKILEIRKDQESSNMLASVDFYEMDEDKDGIIGVKEAEQKESISNGLNKDGFGNIIETPVVDLILNSYRNYRELN